MLAMETLVQKQVFTWKLIDPWTRFYVVTIAILYTNLTLDPSPSKLRFNIKVTMETTL